MDESKPVEIFRKGNLDEVKKLISSNREIKFNLPLRKNPLHYAAENENSEVLLYLLEETHLKSEINTFSENEVAPIHIAGMRGNIKNIRILIEHHADYEKKDCMGRDLIRVLKSASRFNLVPEMEKIIKRKKLTTHLSPEKENVLKKGDLEAVKKLFSEYKYFLCNLGMNPLHFAVANSDINVLIYLLDEVKLKPDCSSATGITPLHEAARYGNLKAIRLLIERGVDYNKRNTLDQNIIDILKAVKKFDLIPQVEEIIKKKNIDNENENILKKGNLAAVKKLLSQNQRFLFHLGTNPLHYAVANPDIKILSYLIDEVGWNPDCPSDRGITPLHEAARYGNLAAIGLLIARGADYNKKNFSIKISLIF